MIFLCISILTMMSLMVIQYIHSSFAMWTLLLLLLLKSTMYWIAHKRKLINGLYCTSIQIDLMTLMWLSSLYNKFTTCRLLFKMPLGSIDYLKPKDVEIPSKLDFTFTKRIYSQSIILNTKSTILEEFHSFGIQTNFQLHLFVGLQKRGWDLERWDVDFSRNHLGCPNLHFA